MSRYRGYHGLFLGARVVLERLVSHRPPPAEPQWRDPANRTARDEAECAAVEACQHFYRDRSALRIPWDGLCRVLGRVGKGRGGGGGRCAEQQAGEVTSFG